MKSPRTYLERNSLHHAIGILFSFEEHWLDFFYSHQDGVLRLPPEDLILEAGCFSRGEQLLIKVALELWTGQRYVSLSELISALDFDSLIRVIIAVMQIRDISVENLTDQNIFI